MAQAANITAYAQAIEFIITVFGPTTEQPVFFQTLANDKGDPEEGRIKSQLLTREPERVIRFVAKHDRFRRGMFYCTSTLAEGSATRNKETVRETPGLHSDLDFKHLVEDEPTIRAHLARLRYQPSILVRSGGGLHCYWLFREGLDTQAYLERIENALRRLAWLLGGDPSVCEVAHLMRLPGTHNSKYGDLREVACEQLDGERRYELDDLEGWLDEVREPILTRKEPVIRSASASLRRDGSGDPALPPNPFLAAGERWGFRPPLDVEAMLDAMAPGNIHVTQRDVSASLIKAGHDLEEVVTLLLEVTRLAAGDLGAKWNWKTEERKIRGMSESALLKYPPRKTPSEQQAVPHETIPDADDRAATGSEKASESATGEGATGGAGEGATGGATVVDIKSARKGQPKSKKSAVSTHIILAQAMMVVIRQRGQDILFTDIGDCRYNGGLWRLETDKSLKTWLDSRLEECARGLSMETADRLIREARNFVLRMPDLHRENIGFDQHGRIPTGSGLIDPRTGEVTPAVSTHYCTWRIPFDYDPAAACPHWLQMLEDVFADRAPEVRALHIQIIQELLGAGLIDHKSKALSRALVLVGGSDYGKSGLIDVMAGLFGERKNATPMDALELAHGLMPFAHRVPWVLHEAFDAGKWHMSSVVKALISGDEVQINVKGGKIFSHRFTAPAIWGANSAPNFKEATDAIINRLVVIECRRKFDVNNLVGTALAASQRGFNRPQDLVLATEMPGVLAWAVEGLRRALLRGYFVLPDDAILAAENVRIDSNLVAGFMRDCVEFDPNNMVSIPDFCAAFASWWLENKGEGYGIPRAERIGWAIKALGEPRIAHDRNDLRERDRRLYAGVKLNAEGRRHWKNTVSSDAYVFQGRTTNTSEVTEGANKMIPLDWDSKPAIEAMRWAYEKMRDRSRDHLVATGGAKTRSSDDDTV